MTADIGTYLNPGSQGFAEIRRSRYVDKSGLIGVINRRLNTRDKLVCVSRPRRFGKSFAATMLCAYYGKNGADASLFHGLQIEKDATFTTWLGKLDVIYLDITGFISDVAAAGDSVDLVVQNIRQAIENELRKAFPDISGNSTGELLVSASRLYGERFFFVIDEWDALFREEAFNRKVQDEYMNFLRSLFKNGNVTAQAIAGAYMTGILPIRKDGSESAISDFDEFTMLRPGELFPYFGFTDEEVKMLCTAYKMDFAEARRWYDGYSDPEGSPMYNPYSVMQAMKNHKFGSYWRQSSATDVLTDYIDMDFDGLSASIAGLLGGVAEHVDISGFNNDLVSLKNKDDVLTLLIHLGYLSYDEDNETVHIPNEEIRLEFARTIREVKSADTLRRVRESEQLILNTAAGREKEVAEEIEKVHEEETSPLFYNNEQALRSVIKLAYFAYRDYFVAMEELPSGLGYADVAYIPKKGSPLPAMVVELKWNQSAETAITQIRQKHYPKVLQQFTDNILLVGIAYQKDDPQKKHTCKIERL